MSYVVQVIKDHCVFATGSRETFAGAVEASRAARERWPGSLVTIANPTRMGAESPDGLTDAELDALDAIEAPKAGRAWGEVRDIAARLISAGFDAEEVREQMHGWVDDAVRAATRRAE